MRRIEKTKKNIGISELDIQTRKRLFDEFVDAGGEVIKEKEDRGLSDFDRDLQRRYRHQLEEIRKQKRISRNKPENEYKKISKKVSGDEKGKYKLSKTSHDIKNVGRFRLFFQRLNIRFRLFFMNVADFSSYYFTLKFLNDFDDEYKSSLLSVQMMFINLFKQNMRTGQRIIDHLDRMHPIYFELIELLSNVFDRTIANEILEHYYNFPDISQETKDLQGPFTYIFKKLHPLYLYKEFILTGLERALTLQMRLEKKRFPFYSASKKKTKNDIYIIFNKFYPRLYWLICSYEGRIFLSDKDIEASLSIPAENMPGRRKRNVSKTFELSFSDNLAIKDSEKEEKEKNQDQSEMVPDHVKKGLDLMKRIDPERYREIYGKNHIIKLIKNRDKIFNISLLLDELDREYSFILTTNKIKFNTLSKSLENLDYKSKFAGIYNEIGKCKNRLKYYADTLGVFEKLKKEKPISSTQYIEYSNRLTALEKERNQAGYDARMFVKAFLEKLCKELKTLIDDMDTVQNIVINSRDMIIFEKEIEGEKKLNGSNVYEAIMHAYSYAMAFLYRLSPDLGDLCGEIEFKEGEENILDSNIFKKGANDMEHTMRNKETVKKDSILKELDDLL